ncbi:MAG: hypothetical protein LIO96_03350, partial [Lachnospiraceae bacterium]|nr:hypothetical protein [Lachnospiraceae bacterium]
MYYAIVLLLSMASGDSLRATISLGMNDSESDQNLLSANIGVGAIIAFANAGESENKSIQIFNIFAVIVI